MKALFPFALTHLAVCVLACVPLSAHALDGTVATYQPATRVAAPAASSAQPSPGVAITRNDASTILRSAVNGNTQQVANRAAKREAQKAARDALPKNSSVSRGDANAAVNGALSGNLDRVGTRIAKREAQKAARDALPKNSSVSRGDANAAVNGALNGNLDRVGTRIATREAQKAARDALPKNSTLSRGDANAVVNGVANGNLDRVGTRIATREAQKAARDALPKNSTLSRGDANAVVNGVANGNLDRVGTRIATREGTKALNKATGLSTGLSRSLVSGALKGLSNKGNGEASSPTFVQKNDYVAATDDGQIRYGSDRKLSAALKNLGYMDATKLSLSAEGVLKNAAGQVAGRLDKQTNQLFNAAGKPMAENTIEAKRMRESILQPSTQLASASATSGTNASSTASRIPAGFNNTNWDESTRTKEWAKLLPAQQEAWTREAAVKASVVGSGTGRQAMMYDGAARGEPSL